MLDANASLFLNLAGVPAEHLVQRREGGERAAEPRVAGGEGESPVGVARCVYAQTGALSAFSRYIIITITKLGFQPPEQQV